MEPTSSPQSQHSADGAGEDADAAHICTVCHRSIPGTADDRWLEALVHRSCLAELRCGVSLGESGRRRTRKREQH